MQVRQMLDTSILIREGRVLDLCCGAGRHLIPMRESGLDAVGLDLSMELLTHGKLGGGAVRADARAIPFADARFDCVTNLFSSFGYFPDDAAHHKVLNEIARVLKPGGRLVIDHMNARTVIEGLVPESSETRDELTLKQTRRYEPDSKRVIKEIEYIPHNQPTRRWHESVRLFTPNELDELLNQSGFTIQARYGDLDGSRFDESTSQRQVVVCEGPEIMG